MFHWYIVYMLPLGMNAAVSLEGENLRVCKYEILFSHSSGVSCS